MSLETLAESLIVAAARRIVAERLAALYLPNHPILACDCFFCTRNAVAVAARTVESGQW